MERLIKPRNSPFVSSDIMNHEVDNFFNELKEPLKRKQ